VIPNLNATQSQSSLLRSKTEIDQWEVKNPQNIFLLEVIEDVHPTILISSSTVRLKSD
jgi:hypothetical protein